MLLKRGKNYYVRVHVPADMIDRFGGRAELKKSLKTGDKREAKAAATAIAHKAQVAFLRVRTGMLSERELEVLSGELIAEFTGRIDQHRAKFGKLDDFIPDGIPYGLEPTQDIDRVTSTFKFPKSVREAKELAEFYAKRVEWCEEQLATGLFSDYIRRLAAQQVEERGLDVELPPPEWFNCNEPEWLEPPPADFARVCASIAAALIPAYQVEEERVSGKKNTPLQQQTQARIEAAKPRPRLNDLWQVYRATKKSREDWTEGTEERITSITTQILDILGNCELSELEDESKAVYLSSMLQKYPASKEKKAAFKGKPFKPSMAKHKSFKPLSVTSINKCIDHASTLMKFAMENRRRWGVEFNPFAKSQLPDNRPPDELRDAYHAADLAGLVEALRIEMKYICREPENYWIPLLALFTGARQNELCGLRVEDAQTIDGIACIEIRHRPEYNQMTKTKKDRTIPLHDTLIELGFMEYCKGVKGDRLWPNLELYKGKWQHEFSKRYCRTVRQRIHKAGGGQRKDFHGLRHTFLNHFKQNLPLTFDNAKVLKSIAGHLDNFDIAIIGAIAEDMTFDRYGKPYKLQKQSELIKLLDYGIDFSVLKVK